MNLSILGTKGAGKGTQLAKLASHLNLVPFSPGDVFRLAAKNKTALGQLAEKCILRGELVPDDIVNGMVEEWLWTTTPVQGIAFDGFPRTTFQAVFLETVFADMGRKLDAVIYIEVADTTVIERLSGRRRCRLCTEEFHLTSAPFTLCPYSKCEGQYLKQLLWKSLGMPRDGAYSKCEGQYLKQLEEDRPEVISTLVNVFQRGIQPLLEHYRKNDRLIMISGEGSAEDVHYRILQALSKRQ